MAWGLAVIVSLLYKYGDVMYDHLTSRFGHRPAEDIDVKLLRHVRQGTARYHPYIHIPRCLALTDEYRILHFGLCHRAS